MRSLLSCIFLLAGLSVAWGQPQSGRSGIFDYYLFTLSWSPEFCHSHPNAGECTSRQSLWLHRSWAVAAVFQWPIPGTLL